MNDDLLTINQAAEKISLRPGSLRELCRNELITFMKIGPNKGLYRFKQEWLDEYLESCICVMKTQQKKAKPVSHRKSATIDKPAMTVKEQMAQIRRNRNKARA